MDSDHNSDEHKDLPSALSHIKALQKQLAESNAELSEVRQREEAAREWVALGMVPRPGSDVSKQMSEIRAILMAFSGAALKAHECGWVAA